MSKHRVTRAAALSLALAAFVAPAASAAGSAGSQVPDRSGADARDAAAIPQAPGDLRNLGARGAVIVPQARPVDLRSPDARDAARAAQPVVVDLRSPDARDAAAGRSTVPDANPTVVRVPEPAPAAGGMDWGDAGIGAGALLGLILLGAGGMYAVTHRRRGATVHRPATPAG